MKQLNALKLIGAGLVALIVLTASPIFAKEVKAEPTATAVCDSSTGTVTFYYDEVHKAGGNMVAVSPTRVDLVGNSPKVNGNAWYQKLCGMAAGGEGINYVVFDKSFIDFEPQSTAYWFHGCTKLQSIQGLEYLNTSKVTDMTCMFFNCEKLSNLDLSNFDTGNVTIWK